MADPRTLEARAYSAAITRAKALAEQTATQAGLKLGEITSITNSDSGNRFGRAGGRDTMYAVEVSAPKPKLPMLELHPAVVEREASVTVTYTIAP